MFLPSPAHVRRVLNAAASTGLSDEKYSEPLFAAFMVSKNLLGDQSAWGCPLARFFRYVGIPNAKVYADYFTYGVSIPFTHLYLIKIRRPLPDRLRDFQTHGYRYPILFDPSASRTLADRLSFVLSLLGRTPQGAFAMSEMISKAIDDEEITPGGAIELTASPSIYDGIAVNDLLQSVADTSQSKGK